MIEVVLDPKLLPKNNYFVTIGNYDGVHLGHQEILQHLRTKAYQSNYPSLVIIFEPQPDEFFLKTKADPRIMSLREKAEAMDSIGIDFLLVLRFNNKLLSDPPEIFAKKILVELLQIKYLIIGDDFVFGHKRKGDYSLLKKLGEKYHFQVDKTSTIRTSGVRVSSSLVRQTLLTGNFQLAKNLLGRAYTISGKVAYGNQIGRQLGYPTANIYIHERRMLIRGVFGVKIHGLENESLYGIANIGTRPTINGSKNILEFHILNFNQNIYGKRLRVEFLFKIRDEIKFASLDKLKKQIAIDISQVEKFLL